jgi:DNA-binding winged helix-turn-helix (wHTH) protein/tetratricopeptide (TPR) repeat protein
MIHSDRLHYEFGAFRLDTAKHLLFRGSQAVPLTPKAFETLLILVEKSGQAVSKDELMQEIWPDTFVEEGSLTRNISVLRKIFQESPSQHDYIETIPKLGYRFVAPVRKVYDSSAIHSISVLPFKNLSRQSGDEYLGVGMADALITKLSNIRQIITRPTSAVLKYAHEVCDPLAVGRELNTDAVLDGSIQRYEDRIRVTVQFLSVPDAAPLWANQFDEQFTHVFSLQDSISEKLLQVLTLKLTGEQQKLLTKRYTEDTEAYQIYLKGRYFWNKREPQSLQKAVGFFKQAIEKDSGYALAYSGLADCYVLLVMYGGCPAAEPMAQAREAAERAVQLDETLAEAHTSLAYVNATYYWDWLKSDREFRRAIDLNYGYSTAHHWFGIFLLMQGRIEQAVGELTLAQHYDPLSLSINTDIGWAFYFARQYERAIEQYLSTIELDKNFLRVYWFLGQSYVQIGRFEEAIAAYQQAIRMSDHPLSFGFLGHAYGLSGRREEALGVLAELEAMADRCFVSPYFIALIYIGLGDLEQAFTWLQKVVEERFWVLAFLKIDPTFDPLRADPRFDALQKQIASARIQ